MKNARPRKPTRNEKKVMTNAGLDWHTWLVCTENKESGKLHLVSKKSGIRRTLEV